MTPNYIDNKLDKQIERLTELRYDLSDGVPIVAEIVVQLDDDWKEIMRDLAEVTV